MKEIKTSVKSNFSSGLLLPVFVLTSIGILMVYSSSSIVSLEKYGNSFYFVRNHLITVLISLTALFLMSKIKYTVYCNRCVVTYLLFASFLLLCLVFIPGIGVTAGGATRWISVWPSTFQPSEFAKLSMIIFMSYYISKNIYRMERFFYGMFIPLSIMGVFQIVLLMQPDFGAAMSLGFITIALLFIGGARKKYFLGLFFLTIPLVALLLITAPYRMARVTAFIDPWKDPMGKGYQLIQSFIALGNGGLTGLGPGGSIQKLYFLPESHTDFIFSIIGEEFGLLGVTIVLILFLWILIKGWKIAVNKEDSFAYFLASGLTIMISFQALVNFCVTTGLLPTKGLPLPFISYGGSALLINMAALGMLINIENMDISPLKNRIIKNHSSRRIRGNELLLTKHQKIKKNRCCSPQKIRKKILK